MISCHSLRVTPVKSKTLCAAPTPTQALLQNVCEDWFNWVGTKWRQLCIFYRCCGLCYVKQFLWSLSFDVSSIRNVIADLPAYFGSSFIHAYKEAEIKTESEVEDGRLIRSGNISDHNVTFIHEHSDNQKRQHNLLFHLNSQLRN